MTACRAPVLAIGLVCLGLILLAASLPCPWMEVTPNNVFRVEGFRGGPVDLTVGETTTLYGSTGYLTLGIAFYIWLFVSVGMIGQGILLGRLVGLRAHPAVVILAPFCFALFFVGAAIYIPLASDQATLGFGPFVALAGLLAGLVPLFLLRDEPAANRAEEP